MQGPWNVSDRHFGIRGRKRSRRRRRGQNPVGEFPVQATTLEGFTERVPPSWTTIRVVRDSVATTAHPIWHSVTQMASRKENGMMRIIRPPLRELDGASSKRSVTIVTVSPRSIRVRNGRAFTAHHIFPFRVTNERRCRSGAKKRFQKDRPSCGGGIVLARVSPWTAVGIPSDTSHSPSSTRTNPFSMVISWLATPSTGTASERKDPPASDTAAVGFVKFCAFRSRSCSPI